MSQRPWWKLKGVLYFGSCWSIRFCCVQPLWCPDHAPCALVSRPRSLAQPPPWQPRKEQQHLTWHLKTPTAGPHSGTPPDTRGSWRAKILSLDGTDISPSISSPLEVPFPNFILPVTSSLSPWHWCTWRLPDTGENKSSRHRYPELEILCVHAHY